MYEETVSNTRTVCWAPICVCFLKSLQSSEKSQSRHSHDIELQKLKINGEEKEIKKATSYKKRTMG